MKDFLRLLGAWVHGRYRVYLVSPVDLIPDFIPGIGFIDDLAMFGFLIRSLIGDTRRFSAWRARGNAPSSGRD